jgi:hypothetical protein
LVVLPNLLARLLLRLLLLLSPLVVRRAQRPPPISNAIATAHKLAIVSAKRSM